MTSVELLEQNDARELVGQSELAQGKAMIKALELETERAADHEAEIATAAPPLLEECREGEGVELGAVTVQQRDEGAVRQAAENLLVLANLDQLQPRVSGQQLLIVAHIVGEGRTQTSHSDDDDPHGGILRAYERPEPP